MAWCKSIVQEVLFEWLHHRILLWNSEVKIALNIDLVSTQTFFYFSLGFFEKIGERARASSERENEKYITSIFFLPYPYPADLFFITRARRTLKSEIGAFEQGNVNRNREVLLCSFHLNGHT